MKNINALLLVMVIFYSCSSESNSQEAGANTITLSGKVVNPAPNGAIVLSRYLDSSGNADVLDTIELKDDKYTIRQAKFL